MTSIIGISIFIVLAVLIISYLRNDDPPKHPYDAYVEQVLAERNAERLSRIRGPEGN